MRKRTKLIALLFTAAIVVHAGSIGGLHVKAASTKPMEETEPNDTYGKATAIQTGQVYVGNINTDDGKDWYKFEISKDGYFQINITPDVDADTSLLQYGWKVSVYGQDAANSIRVYESCKSLTTPAIPYAPGTYYVKIENQSSWYDTNAQKYNICVIETEDSLWETEVNDKIAQANELIVNQQNSGYIEKAGDADWFKFSIKEPGYFTLKLAPGVDANTDLLQYGWDLIVYGQDATTKFLSFSSTKGVTTREQPFAVGEYYIKMQDHNSYYSTCCQPDSLTLLPVADATWENEDCRTTFEGAKEISFGTEYKGRLYSELDVDYFAFNLDNECDVFFDWNIFDDSGEDIKKGWKVSILGGEGNAACYEMNEIKATGNAGSTKLSAGRYYVKVAAQDVSKWNGNAPIDCKYGLKVTAKNSNPSNCFVSENGKMYWYEGGVRQGTYDDPKGVIGDGTVRGREIFDPATDGWYWLDAVYDGAKACNKEVWMPYIYQNEASWGDAEIEANANNSGSMKQQVINFIKNRYGKWVRYDANGKMVKGWYTVEGADAEIYPTQVGNTYYYDYQTGLMAKGWQNIDGKDYYFDEQTGVLVK